MLRRMPEDVVGFEHLIERELVGDELLGRKLVLGDELQQHPEGIGVHQAHRDVDVLDPELVEGEVDGLAVHTDIGDVAPGRTMTVAMVNVSGTPTASMATSTPRPSVSASTCSFQSGSPQLTVSVAPKSLALATRPCLGRWQ